ncbi:MAG TPA: S41 family peptidase [Terriglobales bacterium]|jgi:carboxyl-terminal processing protease|nr:S41 family peptidase [Terriglobales bacterium]
MTPIFSRLKFPKLLALFFPLLLFLWLSVFAWAGHPKPLSPKQRLKLFDQVWQLVNERYYDPAFNGVDWKSVRERYRPHIASASSDDDFYTLLKEMTGELHDAHTRFRSPAERERSDKSQASTPGIAVGELDGAPVVITVDSDSEAARAGVEPGMIVATVDGVPFAERLAQVREEVGTSSSKRATALISYHRILTGEPESSVRLGLLRPDGTTLDVTLTRHLIPLAPPVFTRQLPSGYIYLKFGMFDETAAREFKEALARASGAPGIVIDLRGNPGGDLQTALRIAGGFFADKVSFGKVISRSGKAPSLLLRILGVPSELEVGRPGGQIYSGPVVILVNEGSGSDAELFSAGMQENGRAAIVGRQTCGCVLASIAHRVKGGGELDISEFNILTAKGNRLEGTGVMPDVPVPLTLEDLRRHHDATLREAVAVLNSSNAARSAVR